MELTVLAVLGVTVIIELCDANNINSKPAGKSRRTYDLVEDAFLEQKDVLLEMLESKLKEVKGKKKKKSDQMNLGSNFDQLLPKNGQLKLSANGISSVGEIDAQLRFGEPGKGTLKLNAVGISNVGRSHIDLDVGSNVRVPGISGLFMGNLWSNNSEKVMNETEIELKQLAITTLDNRRLGKNDTVNVTKSLVTNKKKLETSDVTESEVKKNHGIPESSKDTVNVTKSEVTNQKQLETSKAVGVTESEVPNNSDDINVTPSGANVAVNNEAANALT